MGGTPLWSMKFTQCTCCSVSICVCVCFLCEYLLVHMYECASSSKAISPQPDSSWPGNKRQLYKSVFLYSFRLITLLLLCCVVQKKVDGFPCDVAFVEDSTFIPLYSYFYMILFSASQRHLEEVGLTQIFFFVSVWNF